MSVTPDFRQRTISLRGRESYCNAIIAGSTAEFQRFIDCAAVRLMTVKHAIPLALAVGDATLPAGTYVVLTIV